jgi:N-methylhydantoinase A
MPDGKIEIAHLHLRVTKPRTHAPALVPAWPEGDRSLESRTVYFNAHTCLRSLEPHEALVLWRPSLDRSARVAGPAVLEQYDSATVVPPGWVATVDNQFNLDMSRS